jgi:recombinational DNA repair ATPase RecF
MQINSVILTNFKLFKSAEISFSKINIITGENGAGKSTIIKGILYALYGEGCGNILTDLISFGNKECSVELNCSLNNEHLIIERKVPTALAIFKNNQEVQFNSVTLKQQWINEQIKDFNFFKKYRLLNKQAINLLDLGIISLRKELMTFIDDKISLIRQQLLAKKLERETYNVDKRLYKFYLSDKRIAIINKGLDIIKADYTRFQLDKNTQQGIVNQIKSDIQSKEKIIYYKKNEIKTAKEGICPILKSKCDKIAQSLSDANKNNNLTITKELDIITHDIICLEAQLDNEKDALEYYDSILEELEVKERKARECLLKLKEAMKFKEYKYTKADVVLYADAIKTLDNFSGWYIQTWLDNLTLVINNLLESMKISVFFTADKQFLMIKNENQEMKYENLSEGQQVFLNIVFKIAVLLQNGINDGILLIDDAVNSLMLENIYKLVDVLKQTPFQTFIIKQDIDKTISDVNYINAIRNEGESHVE